VFTSRSSRRLLFALLLVLLWTPSVRRETPLDPMLEELASRDTRERAWAVHELAHEGREWTAVVVPRLISMLNDPEPLVRARAAEGLSHYDGYAALIIERLQPALHDPSPLVHEAAALAVRRLERPRARKAVSP
jgi:HEAT repeat protein